MNGSVSNWALLLAGVSLIFGLYVLVPAFLALAFVFNAARKKEEEAEQELSIAAMTGDGGRFVSASAYYWGMFLWGVVGFIVLLLVFGGGIYLMPPDFP